VMNLKSKFVELFLFIVNIMVAAGGIYLHV
jgi:hypothetical protein